MMEQSYQSTTTARERYFSARDEFERALHYRHLGQMEAITLMMDGRFDAAMRRLQADGLLRDFT